jgi:uncharacterized repeat protein (TIGR03803 family)
MKACVKRLLLAPALAAALGLMPAGRVSAQTFAVLHNFTALKDATNSDGAFPIGELILSGNTLYGTASGGGTNGDGTVFGVNNDGSNFKNLHSFLGHPNDGAYPGAGLILSGNTLYGTANQGGGGNYGTVFAVNTNASGFTNLYGFTDGNDGSSPADGLILSGSTLYGTASGGGTNGDGTVFAVNTNGTSFTNLYGFTGGNDGADPNAGLVLSGNILYGTAPAGGTNGEGTVFAITTNGAFLAALHDFTSLTNSTNNDGAYPVAGLILSVNILYGTAAHGGINGQGTVFAVNTNGTGFTNLYNFTGGSDGAVPYGRLVLSGSTLYGTASGGGSSGNGTVFSVNTDGSGFTILHSFSAGAYSLTPFAYTNSDGAYPQAGLLLSSNILYGTTEWGGTNGDGTVFALNLPSPPITLPAGGWTEEAPLPVALYGSVAASLNGTLYVAGGNNGGNPYTTATVFSTLYAYNPIANTWSSRAAMPDIRYTSDGMEVISNQLYVPGGWTQVNPALPHDNLWTYDPVSNAWSIKAGFPPMNGNPGLSGNCAGGVINGKLYVQTSEDGWDGYYNFLHVYNPANNTWTQLANSPASHAAPGFGVISNKFYVVGGNNSSGTTGELDVYDPASSAWTTKRSMPTPINNPASAVLNGKLYLIGGSDAFGNITNIVQVYDPATDTWTTNTPMPTRRGSATAAVWNGTIYVIGGYNGTNAVAVNEAFMPVVIPPTITNQPPSITSSSGATTTLSVNASGTPPFVYQWMFDGVNIPGATNATLSLANVSTANLGSYSVEVANPTGYAVSAPIDLTIANLEMIAGVVINGSVGTNYSLQSIPALGNGSQWTTLTNINLPSQPYTYTDYGSLTNPQQYYRLASANAAAHSASLGLDMFTALNLYGTPGTNYDLQSTSDGGNSWATMARVSLSTQPYLYIDYSSPTNPQSYRVVQGPSFISQPVSTTVGSGGTAVLSAGVSNASSLSYQWTFDGANIAGANNLSLTITNVTPAEVGFYALTINDGAAPLTSATASLATVDLRTLAGLIINGSIGTNYFLQSRATLQSSNQWTTLTNITLPSQPYTYIDFGSLTNPQAYYRLAVTNAATPPTPALDLFTSLIINGPIGHNYGVQGLGNSGWTTLTNVNLQTQPYIYIDYNSPTNPQQSYRAVSQ